MVSSVPSQALIKADLPIKYEPNTDIPMEIDSENHAVITNERDLDRQTYSIAV